MTSHAKKSSDHSHVNLAEARAIDFSEVTLNFDGFRQLALNPNLSDEEKIGFPPSYRRGLEDLILADILRKLTTLEEEGRVVVDIGCGIGGLMERMVSFCSGRSHHMILVDSDEMPERAPRGSNIDKVPGLFPTNLAEVREACGGGADAVLCYSVLHCVFIDGNPFRFIDSVVDLLNVGGMALIGEIPNLSKRQRFFSSPIGVAAHKAFMKTTEPPKVTHFGVAHESVPPLES